MISQLSAKVQLELGVRATIEAILRSVVDLFSARRIVLVLKDADAGRSFRWEVLETLTGRSSTAGFSELPASEAEEYFLFGPRQGWSAMKLRGSGTGEPLRCLVLEEAGKWTCDLPGSCPENFHIGHDFGALLGVTFTFGKEWTGRLFVMDPGGTADVESELRLLDSLVHGVGLAVHSQYLLRRLRSRVRAAERASVARELHDGVIQSLLAVDMQLTALRRSTLTDPGPTIERAQQVVRREIVNMRELMDRIRPVELCSSELVDTLAEIVDRFRRETIISASFLAEAQEVTLPPRVCSELVRILQEALFNIRRHSLATKVLVKLVRCDGFCKLVIEDDGRGFEFSGRFSQPELEAIRKGPRVIQERVRSIGGQLVIDSTPERGARLEISLPQESYG